MAPTAHTAALQTRQADSAPILLRYFNGRSSKSETVLLSISELSAQLIREFDGVLVHELPVKGIRWPERTARGARIIELPDGGQLHADDARAYDAWAAAHLPKPESWVVRAQQSWRGVMVSFVALLAVLAGLYHWGLPVVASGIASLVPTSVDEALGRQALRQIDGQWMQPSKLPADTQQRIRARFATAMQRAYPAGVPTYQLEFRKSNIGPNAFALPGGTMVLTDELVNLVKDDEVVMGVMGHEMGHVTERHGLRQLVQLAVLQGALGIAFGDYGSFITIAPLILGSMAYSREAEREADAQSIRFMQANAISPLVMVRFFQAMQAEQQKKNKGDSLDISIISSHPGDEERMAAFRKASGQ
jgi:Zn-dependent protease with chaperone function